MHEHAYYMYVCMHSP